MEFHGTQDVSERRPDGFLLRTPPFLSGVAVGLVFLLVTGSLLALMSHFGARQQERIAVDHLRGLAAAAVQLVDADSHEKLRNPADTDSALYERTVAPLVDFHNLLPDIYWVYTVRPFEGRLFYVLDTAASPRLRLSRERDQVARVMDPVLDSHGGEEPDMLPTVLSGGIHVDARSHRWGGRDLRSVGAPLRDGRGNVTGVLVLDVEEGTFNAEQKAFRFMVHGGAAVCLGLSLLAGLITARLHGGLLEAIGRLERESVTDALTGLGNRAFFNRSLGSEMAQARRAGTPFTLLVFDIDHFKRVNDDLGHPAGDEVLSRIGERLRAEVREGDVCCRIGGEEFALLMPGIGRQEGEAAFNRIAGAIRMPMLIEGGERTITISGGISTMSGSDIRPEEILRLADRALYEAKRSGRDRVVVATQGP